MKQTCLFTVLLAMAGAVVGVCGCALHTPSTAIPATKTLSPTEARDQKTQQYILEQREKARKTRRTHTAH